MNSSKKYFDVTVIGAAGIDTNIYLYGNDIDFNVEANFTENIDYVGQAGGYSSRGFAQLGKKTAYIGFIGDDYQGKFIQDELEKDGIEAIFFIDPMGTKRSINFMYKDGRRKNFYDGKGSMVISPDIATCKKILEKSRLTHFSIVNWTRYLLPVAKDLGLTVSCDIQDVITIDDAYRKDYVDYADILLFSAVNFSDTDKIIRIFQKRRPNCLIIAGMGSKGCAVGIKGDIKFFQPVELAKPVIDTNGAGDGLAVGFLSSYCMDGYSLEDSILRGQINARYTCTLKATTTKLMNSEMLDNLFYDYKKN